MVEPRGSAEGGSLHPASLLPSGSPVRFREYRARLVRFYKFYNPAKLVMVDDMLRDARGGEEDLFEALVRMYGPEPHAGMQDREYRKRLTAFYRHYNPDRLSDVDALLADYRGREDQLFAALEHKYGPEPGARGGEGAAGGGDGRAVEALLEENKRLRRSKQSAVLRSMAATAADAVRRTYYYRWLEFVWWLRNHAVLSRVVEEGRAGLLREQYVNQQLLDQVAVLKGQLSAYEAGGGAQHAAPQHLQGTQNSAGSRQPPLGQSTAQRPPPPELATPEPPLLQLPADAQLPPPAAAPRPPEGRGPPHQPCSYAPAAGATSPRSYAPAAEPAAAQPLSPQPPPLSPQHQPQAHQPQTQRQPQLRLPQQQQQPRAADPAAHRPAHAGAPRGGLPPALHRFSSDRQCLLSETSTEEPDPGALSVPARPPGDARRSPKASPYAVPLMDSLEAGHPGGADKTLRPSPVVMLRMDLSLQSFDAAGLRRRVAPILGIKANQVEVLSVARGSVIARLRFLVQGSSAQRGQFAEAAAAALLCARGGELRDLRVLQCKCEPAAAPEVPAEHSAALPSSTLVGEAPAPGAPREVHRHYYYGPCGQLVGAKQRVGRRSPGRGGSLSPGERSAIASKVAGEVLSVIRTAPGMAQGLASLVRRTLSPGRSSPRQEAGERRSPTAARRRREMTAAEVTQLDVDGLLGELDASGRRGGRQQHHRRRRDAGGRSGSRGARRHRHHRRRSPAGRRRHPDSWEGLVEQQQRLDDTLAQLSAPGRAQGPPSPAPRGQCSPCRAAMSPPRPGVSPRLSAASAHRTRVAAATAARGPEPPQAPESSGSNPCPPTPYGAPEKWSSLSSGTLAPLQPAPGGAACRGGAAAAPAGDVGALVVNPGASPQHGLQRRF